MKDWLDNLYYGKGYYVFKAWIPEGGDHGTFQLAFSKHWRGHPAMYADNRGWSPFEPGRITRRDTGHVDWWCRVYLPKMRWKVDSQGYYIAPPQKYHLFRFTSVQAVERKDGKTEVFTRYGYSYDRDPAKLPTALNLTIQVTPWELERAFDISSEQTRKLISFWSFQQWLEHSYYLEPYTPSPTEQDLAKVAQERAKAEEEKRLALENERLKAIEAERQRFAKVEQRKTEWPYNQPFWPKNGLQALAFVVLTLLGSSLLCFIGLVMSQGSFLLFLTTAILSLFVPVIAAVFFNPYFYKAAPLPPEAPPPPPPPIRERIEERLRAAIMEHDLNIPPAEVMKVILSVGETIYNTPRATPHTGNRPVEDGHEQRAWDAMQAKWEKADDLIFEAIVQSMSAYIYHLPLFDSAPFHVRFGSTSVSGSAINDIMRPFTFNDELKELGLAKSLTDRFNANVGAYTQSVKKPLKTLWPQRYQGKPEDIVPTYLQGTPMQMLFDVLVPYNPFPDDMRFTHHWCMGDTGSGKTTYLRHLIKHDLERAIKKECSLIVLDSKTLVREMRTLKQFEQALLGDLILIDADEIFPLNPFKLPKAQGLPLLSYMLAGLTDASKLQLGVLRHYINAAYTLENPSLFSLCDLMQAPKDKLPPQLKPDRLDEVTLKWFTHARKGVASLTSGGIEQRLLDFLSEFKDGPFLKMLTADRFALNLKEMDQGGKVLLVDANRGEFGKDAGSLLGRLLIALVDQLSTARTQPGTRYKPLFVYIDEAQDYIAKDEIFADILEKARGSQVSMLVAHHHTKQSGGFLPGVVAALEQSGIKSQCIDAGHPVQVQTRRSSFQLTIPKLEFIREDQMDGPQYEAVRAWLARKYPYAPSGPMTKPARGNGSFDKP